MCLGARRYAELMSLFVGVDMRTAVDYETVEASLPGFTSEQLSQMTQTIAKHQLRRLLDARRLSANSSSQNVSLTQEEEEAFLSEVVDEVLKVRKEMNLTRKP
jgi:hypothetical protein